jgi:hypothetical protein
MLVRASSPVKNRCNQINVGLRLILIDIDLIKLNSVDTTVGPSLAMTPLLPHPLNFEVAHHHHHLVRVLFVSKNLSSRSFPLENGGDHIIFFTIVSSMNVHLDDRTLNSLQYKSRELPDISTHTVPDTDMHRQNLAILWSYHSYHWLNTSTKRCCRTMSSNSKTRVFS